MRDAGAARTYLDRLRRQLPGRDALVQEFLAGAEYALALIGNPESGFTVLPPLEVDYGALDPELPRILSYESKTVPESPYWKQLRYREARLGSRRPHRSSAPRPFSSGGSAAVTTRASISAVAPTAPHACSR